MFLGCSDRLEQEPSGFVLLPGADEPLGLDAEELGLEEARGLRLGQRPHLVEHVSSGSISTLTHVDLGEERRDHRRPDVATGPELVRERLLELCDALLVVRPRRRAPSRASRGRCRRMRVNDLVFERQSPLRFEQGSADVAVDLKHPRELGQRLAEAERVPESLAEGDGLVHLGHRPHRLASQGEGHCLERHRADARIVVGVAERERVVGVGAVDGPPFVGRDDGVIDPASVQRVHPAGVESLQPHRFIAVGGEFEHPSDEGRRLVEVAAQAVEEGEAEVDRELLDGGGARQHQLGGPSVGPLYLGGAQAVQRAERDCQLQLQFGFVAAALVAFGELLDDGDRAGELLDRLRVRREPHRPLPSAVERLRRALTEPQSSPACALLVLGTELDPVAVGPLEVVAEELVELDKAGAVLLQPVGEPLMELRPHRLRQRIVGGVADQQVAEAERILA